MAKEMEPVEIGGIPELVRLAEEVRATGAPRLLRCGGRDVAVLTQARLSTPDAVAATEWDEAIGSWADLDIDAVVAHVYRSRAAGSRPADRP
jgi:hypothetical protein